MKGPTMTPVIQMVVEKEIATGMSSRVTSMGTRAEAAGDKNARAAPNRPAITKIGISP